MNKLKPNKNYSHQALKFSLKLHNKFQIKLIKVIKLLEYNFSKVYQTIKSWFIGLNIIMGICFMALNKNLFN